MKKNIRFAGLLLLISFQSCTQTGKHGDAAKPANDTTALTSLLINIYKWHDRPDQKPDYYLIDDGKHKLGIDTIRLDSSLAEMRKTDFFSEGFLNNYRAIGQRIDHLIRQDTAKYAAGMIDFPFQDYDTWWGGNGVPQNWADIKAYDLHINKENASLRWTWDTTGIHDLYVVRFKRVDDKWRLDYLQDQDLKNY